MCESPVRHPRADLAWGPPPTPKATRVLEYADDRPWPGSTSWSDAVSRSALDAIAAAVVHLTGYEVSCINVVHRGVLRAVAVHGTDEQRSLLMDSHTPVDAVETELQHGDVLGRFVHVPAGRWTSLRDFGAVLDDLPTRSDLPDSAGEPGRTEDAWDPEDILVAPFRDDDGQIVGLLSIDLPVDRLRPDDTTRARLERYAELVEVAVRMALERDEQQERLRLARAARQVVAAATRELSMEAIFAESAEALMSGFSAHGLWLHTFDLAERFGAVHSEGGLVHRVPAELVVVAERIALQAWRAETVSVLCSDEVAPAPFDPGLEEDRETVLAYMRGMGLGSLLLVPVGAVKECLGSLVLTRTPGRGHWTGVEIEAARDVGMDLGRAILNVRSFQRERSAVAELQALDTYRSQLVATLSHELKTPLASVLGNLELLEEEESTSADGRRAISAITRGTHRLVRVVDDLMLLAKVDDPGNQLITRPVDMVHVVEDVIEMTAATATRSGLGVDLHTGEAPPVAVGDAAELDRVVTNLVSNALKYTPRGGQITLDVRRVGHEVVVTCRDTGIGVSEQDRHRLFREFFRSADPAAQGQPGTGLGLAITERIVQRHGGRIEVMSEVGRGSTFQVYLPVWEEATEEVGDEDAEARPPADDAPPEATATDLARSVLRH